jgi:heme/copper-type cytochrome/quinol oxidase subunit 2
VKRLTAILLTGLGLMLLGHPSAALACAACYGASDSPLAQGMNWGIFSLLAVVGTVLGCFLVFFVHIIRKSEAELNDAAPAPAAAEATDKSES